MKADKLEETAIAIRKNYYPSFTYTMYLLFVVLLENVLEYYLANS